MTWMQMNMSDYSISQTQIQVKEQRIDVQPYYLSDNLSHDILLFIDRGRKLR